MIALTVGFEVEGSDPAGLRVGLDVVGLEVVGLEVVGLEVVGLEVVGLDDVGEVVGLVVPSPLQSVASKDLRFAQISTPLQQSFI